MVANTQNTAWANYSSPGRTPNPAMAQYEQRLAESMRMLEGLGKQQKKDLRQRYQAREGAGMQDMVSRGLTGTTILPTMRMGYQREHESELGRLDESLRQQRLGVYGSLTGEMAAASGENYWQRQQQQQTDFWKQRGLGLDQKRLELDQLRQQQQYGLDKSRLGLAATGQNQQYSLGQSRLSLDRQRQQYQQPRRNIASYTATYQPYQPRTSSSQAAYAQPSYLQQAQSRFLIKR